jgi:hypothetical protein
MKNTQNKTSAPMQTGSTRRADESKEVRQLVSQFKHETGQSANSLKDVAIVPLSEKDEVVIEVRKQLCLTLRERAKPDRWGVTMSALSGDALRWMFNRKV